MAPVAGGPAAAPDPEWERLSPLSLLLRGGIVLVAVIGWVVSQFVDRLTKGISEGLPGAPDDPSDGALTEVIAHPWIALGVLLLGLLAVAGVAWVSWRFTRFRISRGHVELRTGWLFRQQRQVPMERIQAVEIGRPLLAQLLGLAKVVVQSAGGRDSNVTLAFLPLARAHDVRDRIQRAAAAADEGAPGTPGAGVDGGPAAPVEVTAGGPMPSGGPTAHDGSRGVGGSGLPGDLLGLAPDSGRPVLSVPNGRLILASVLHGAVIWLVVGLVAWGVVGYALSRAFGSPIGFLGSLPALVPAAFGLLSTRVHEVLRHGNFSMTDHGGALRILHGLTDHRTTTVPKRRVQAIELRQSMWWRPLGWWRAQVNVAGVHDDADDRTNETVVLPVGTLEQAIAVLGLIDPAVDPAQVEVGALGEGGEPGWVTAAPSARYLDPLSWRRRGYAVSGHGVLIRSGRFSRSLVSVPHARIQSLTLAQGPVQRWLGLAGVALVSTPGPVAPVIEHLTVTAAEELLREEAARSHAAGRGGGPAATVPTDRPVDALVSAPDVVLSGPEPCATGVPSDGLSSVSTTETRGESS